MLASFPEALMMRAHCRSRKVTIDDCPMFLSVDERIMQDKVIYDNKEPYFERFDRFHRMYHELREKKWGSIRKMTISGPALLGQQKDVRDFMLYRGDLLVKTLQHLDKDDGKGPSVTYGTVTQDCPWPADDSGEGSIKVFWADSAKEEHVKVWDFRNDDVRLVR